MADESLVLGVDLGGTKIAAGVFDAQHRLLGEIARVPTAADRPAGITLGNLKAAAEQACRSAGAGGARPQAIGIGSTGPVDASSGRVLEAPALPGLQLFDLSGWVREQFGAPLYLENDANCFALAEALEGAGAGHRVVVAVTLGTGFGCGIVIDGVMYAGTTGNAGEVGCCPIAGDTFDNMLSGAGLCRWYERVRGRPSSLSAREIGDLAERDDADALQAWREYGEAVGAALGTIAAVLDPSICVIGGSVAARLALFVTPLRNRLHSILAPAAARALEIAAAKLGPAAGVIGAAEYAFHRMRIAARD